MKTIDWTAATIVVALSLVAVAIAAMGKDLGAIAPILIGIIAAANGFKRSPTQQDAPAVAVVAPAAQTVEIPIHTEPESK
jgi:hypothetical protein